MKDNFVQYVLKNGNRTFEELPFNEVDNLVFSELVYYNLSGIVSERNDEISIKDAYEIFKKDGRRRTIIGKFLIHPVELFGYLADSARFQNCGLSHYISISDEREIQFAAVKIRIDGEYNYIAFRGTDGTMHGWKEDFSIAFKITPSQKLAVRYLNHVIEKNKKNIIGGHSKGGLLALYGSVECEGDLKKDILKVYSNDGPGICEKWFDETQYSLIRHKVVKIVPKHTIVGLLFNNDANIKVVQTSKRGFFQHYMDRWVINGTALKEDRLSGIIKFRQQIIEEWIEGIPLKERENFVNRLFSCFTAGGIRTWTQFANQGIFGFIRFGVLIVVFLCRSGKITGRLIKVAFFSTNRRMLQNMLRIKKLTL